MSEMKTIKILITLLTASFALLWWGCDQEHEMPKFTFDYVSFEKATYTLSVDADTELRIPIFHKNPTVKESKVSVNVLTSIPDNAYTITSPTEFTFSESDTVYLSLDIHYSSIEQCVNYSIEFEIKEGDDYIKVSPYDGIGKATVNFEVFSTIGISELVGTWSGLDAETPYTTGQSYVETELVGDKLMIYGLGFDWITNFWGEVVVDGGTVELEVYDGGDVVIKKQYYITTLYGGNEEDPYTIVGTGRWNNCGEYPTLVINYELNNYDVNWGAWCYARGYISTPTFRATITLDPSKSDIGQIVKKGSPTLDYKPRL
jgi:hypothetical protein